MKTNGWSYLEFKVSGWEICIDLGCWWNHFSRGESGWYMSVGPIMVISPDYAAYYSN